MTILDGLWLGDRAASAAWSHNLLVQPCLEDIDAAIDASQWDVARVAALTALLRLHFCVLAIDGRLTVAPEEVELLASIASSPERAALIARALDEHTNPSSSESAREAQRVANEANRAFLEMLPFDIGAMRTPTGFFPALKTASEIERLRRALGVGPFEWNWWSSLA